MSVAGPRSRMAVPAIQGSLNRRSLLQAGVASVVAAACKAGPAGKAASKEVVLGYVSPKTGPLAALSECDDFVVERVTRALNAKRIVLDGSEATVRSVQAASRGNSAQPGEA